MHQKNTFIHQQVNWPNFTWNSDAILNLLSEARNLQGRSIGRMESIGFDLRNEAILDNLTLDVVKSAEIEGEFLNSDQVRSSIARKLGIEIKNSVKSELNVDNIVDIEIDATQNYSELLTKERLLNWNASQFTTEFSSITDWRKDVTVPIHVAKHNVDNEIEHFEPPDSTLIEQEMNQFLDWFNTNNEADLVIKAAIAHIWFETIHPFKEKNGRITRAITDMLLAQSDESSQRFYSMSVQIRIERNHYFEMLENAQKGSLDLTNWIKYFLKCLINALKSTHYELTNVLFKADFWSIHSKTKMNKRQKYVLNKVLDGFEEKITSSMWSKLAKCSKESAIRDINDLIKKGILQKEIAGGRSTNYEIVK